MYLYVDDEWHYIVSVRLIVKSLEISRVWRALKRMHVLDHVRVQLYVDEKPNRSTLVHSGGFQKQFTIK